LAAAAQSRSRFRRVLQPAMGSSIKATLAFFLLSFALASGAHAETLTSRYSVTLGAFHLGDAVFQASLGAKRYNVSITADVGAFFDNKKVHGEASGTRNGAKLQPAHFRMVMTGDDQNSVDVQFAGTAVKFSNVVPPPTPRALANGTPMTPALLKGVLDPLSALLAASLKAPAPSANPCRDVVPIFTGYARFDLSLRASPEQDTPKNAKTVTCLADYVHIAGLPGPRSLRLEIELMKLTKPRLWLIEHVTMMTPMGKLKIERTETRVG
jgi:hypothetical protein